ncbi:hypothetical protein J6590_015270 [Homalodisca vitripennis]|nr:hypothetical protein J6590_015270 [Homalodisca vitripennis]
MQESSLQQRQISDAAHQAMMVTGSLNYRDRLSATQVEYWSGPELPIVRCNQIITSSSDKKLPGSSKSAEPDLTAVSQDHLSLESGKHGWVGYNKVHAQYGTTIKGISKDASSKKPALCSTSWKRSLTLSLIRIQNCVFELLH